MIPTGFPRFPLCRQIRIRLHKKVHRTFLNLLELEFSHSLAELGFCHLAMVVILAPDLKGLKEGLH